MRIELIMKSYHELLSVYHELFSKLRESMDLLQNTIDLYDFTANPIRQLLEMQLNVSLSHIVSDTLDRTGEVSTRREALSTAFSMTNALYSPRNMTSHTNTFSNRNTQDPFLQVKELLHKEDRLRAEESDKIMKLIKIKTAALKKLLTDSVLPKKEKSILLKALKDIPYPAFTRISRDFLSFRPPELLEKIPTDIDIALAFEHYDHLVHCVDNISEKQLVIENCIFLYTFLIDDMEHYLQWYKKSPDQHYNLLSAYISSGENTLGIKANSNISAQSSNTLHQYVSSAENKISIQTASGKEHKSYLDVLLTTFSSIITLAANVNIGEGKHPIPDMIAPLVSIFSKEHTFLDEICSYSLDAGNEPIKINDEPEINTASLTQKDIILNRHHSSQNQKEYDEHYGLVPLRSSFFQVISSNMFFQHHRFLSNPRSLHQENDEIIANRHRSPQDQRRYDEKFGLIPVRKSHTF